MEIIIILLVYAANIASKIIAYILILLILIAHNLVIYVRAFIDKINKNKKEKIIKVNIYDKKHWKKFSKYRI